MTSEEIYSILYSDDTNIICERFCVFPHKIAEFIDSVAYGNGKYGYILIGVTKLDTDFKFYGIDPNTNMTNIVNNALLQTTVKTKISQEVCKVEGKTVYIIRVKTCEKVIQNTCDDVIGMEKFLKDLISICIKLQANSIYYNASEDQRNDYIRDMLKTAGYIINDQTRRGLSPTGKSAGEVDILVEKNNLPVTIIEALNLNSLNTGYLDMHIDKIYGYDTAGNSFNILLSYVTVANFTEFCDKYVRHIAAHGYPYHLISVDDAFSIDGITYSDMKIVKTVHNRNNKETVLFHVCLLVKGKE